MGVYIKGMEMPKNCILCRLDCLYRIHSSSARSEYCPLIEIAEPKDEPQTEYRIGYYTPMNAEILKAFEDEQSGKE